MATTLYLYATEKQFLSILKDNKLNVSRAWATNDATEGVKKGESQRSENVEEYGYICLSATCNSPSMWGYYADGSKGVCLEFIFHAHAQPDGTIKIPGSKKQMRDSLVIRRVEYCEDRSSTNNIDELLFKKSKEWEHEQEYRIKLNLGNTGSSVRTESEVIFQSDIIMTYLKSVILGVNFCKKKPEVQVIIRNSSVNKDLQVIKSKLNDTSFKIDVDFPTHLYDEDDEEDSCNNRRVIM